MTPRSRYDRVVIPIDFMWVKLGGDKATPLGVVATREDQRRYFHAEDWVPRCEYASVQSGCLDRAPLMAYGNDVELQPSVLGNSFYSAADWVDAVEGVKFQAMLTPKTILTIAGDAGGGGSRLDYQVVV